MNKPTGLHEVGESQLVLEPIHGWSLASGFTFNPKMKLDKFLFYVLLAVHPC